MFIQCAENLMFKNLPLCSCSTSYTVGPGLSPNRRARPPCTSLSLCFFSFLVFSVGLPAPLLVPPLPVAPEGSVSCVASCAVCRSRLPLLAVRRLPPLSSLWQSAPVLLSSLEVSPRLLPRPPSAGGRPGQYQNRACSGSMVAAASPCW